MANVVEFILRAKDEATNKIKGVANELGGIAGTAGKLGASLGTWGAVTAGVITAGAAIVATGKKYVETVEDMERVSTSLGMSMGDLQVFRETFDRLGMAPEAAEKSLKKLSVQIAKNSPLIKQLGLDGMSAGDAFQELMDILANTTDENKRNAIATTLMGKSAGELTGIADEFNSTYAETADILKKNNGLMGEDSIKATQELDHSMEVIGLKWKAMWTGFSKDAVPIATEIVRVLVGLAEAIMGLVYGVGAFLASLGDLKKGWEGIKKGARLMDVGFSTMKGEGEGSLTKETPKIAPRTKKSANNISLRGRYVMNPDTGEMEFIPEGTVKTTAQKEAEAAAKKRAESIREIMDLLQMTSKEAAIAYDALEKVDKSKKAKDMFYKLNPDLEAEDKKFEEKDKAIKALAEASGYTWGQALKAYDDYEAKVKKETDKSLTEKYFGKERDTIDSVVKSYTKAVDATVSLSQTLGDGLDAVMNGLASGFDAVFEHIIHGGMSIRESLKGIFDAMVSELLSILARLAAAEVFKLLLSLIAPQAAASINVLGTIAKTSDPNSPVAPKYGSFADNQTNNFTVNISTLDTRSVVQAFTSPRGEMKNAVRQLQQARAY